MPIVAGYNCRVFLNGIDLTTQLRGLSIEAQAGEAILTTLTTFLVPEIHTNDRGGIDVVLTDRSRPQMGPVALDGQRVRAITIRPNELDIETV